MEPIKGFENYMIDRDGNVFSTKTKDLLTPFLDNNYFRISFRKDGKKYNRRIHRLLALQFIPNPDNLPCVDHIDRDTQNNSLENLRWATISDNTKNSIRKNKTGKRFIIETKWGYRVRINRIQHGSFKNIDDALNYRNEYCEKNNIEIIE